ncbi:hypothetical protein [Halopiger xanaduensis]|uniref:Uncharacterized protein n=1 Tax=Halopiger xanaduensis (strain DSM 18323 / JCM 14033 / SH-6) TaxID=797210 RepID=F8D896_HALXS|nr:hypothetical protein [Halopiger xanaduensis]AEH36736.1 hypothetical protein Halxa_2111 [Halopiger xanaduensis SH-6]
MTADLPESLADSWRPAGTTTGESSVMVASITAETTLYEPLEATDLADLAASKIPLRSLFVVDLSVSPSLSTIGVSPSSVFEKAAPKAKNQFVDTVEDEGLVVEATRDTLEFEAPNGEEGKWYVLDVSYPLESETESDDDADDGRSDTDRISAEANVAVWPTDSSFGVAGGILPLEDGVAGVPDDAVDPERDRDTIAELVETIDLEGDGESKDENDNDE